MIYIKQAIFSCLLVYWFFLSFQIALYSIMLIQEYYANLCIEYLVIMEWLRIKLTNVKWNHRLYLGYGDSSYIRSASFTFRMAARTIPTITHAKHKKYTLSQIFMKSYDVSFLPWDQGFGDSNPAEVYGPLSGHKSPEYKSPGRDFELWVPIFQACY